MPIYTHGVNADWPVGLAYKTRRNKALCAFARNHQEENQSQCMGLRGEKRGARCESVACEVSHWRV